MTPVPNVNQGISRYIDLLFAFQALPKTNRTRTFMDIAGYPHYENVCSNILAFYFNPTEEHGLNDLVLSSFIRMSGQNDVLAPGEPKVYREWVTDAGNRIDLIIESEALTIGIENKVFHHLSNDLEDYAVVIDRLGEGKDFVLKAVLSLHPVRDSGQLKGGFVSYTYGQLWHYVKERLGSYVTDANPKWFSYLIDFMETTTNLAGQNMELQEIDKFFIEHNDVIEKMLAERSIFISRLNQKVATLCAMMREANVTAELCSPPWVYNGSCVVLDFCFADVYKISFDLYLRPTGWELQLFGRNKRSMGYLYTLIKQPPLHARVGNALRAGDRHILETWPIQTDLVAIKDALVSWMDSLKDVAKAVAT